MIFGAQVAALLLADKIVVMQDGKKLCEGSPKELYSSNENPVVQEMFREPLKQFQQIKNRIL